MGPIRHPRASSRLTGLVLVALLHAGLLYGALTGLGQRVVEVLRQPVEIRIIPELVKPPPPPPPPPPVKTVAPPKPVPPRPSYVPPPQVRAPQPATNAITAVTETKSVAPPAPGPVVMEAPPVVEPVRSAPSLDASRSCRPPQYPGASRRNGESGAVTLRFLIDVDGTVLDSRVDVSSGYPRLDEAAVQALSLCQFKPGTVNGAPEKSWARMRYVWKLN